MEDLADALVAAQVPAAAAGIQKPLSLVPVVLVPTPSQDPVQNCAQIPTSKREAKAPLECRGAGIVTRSWAGLVTQVMCSASTNCITKVSEP